MMVPWDSCISETGVRPYLVGREQSLSPKEVDIPSVLSSMEVVES